MPVLEKAMEEKTAIPAVGLGDKLHIITRRLFPEDLRRHFVGEVVAASGGLFELRGFTFVFNSGIGEYRRRDVAQNRVFSLSDSGYIATKLPLDTRTENVEYKLVENRLVVTDNGSFQMDINEFGPGR
jgi:hypothetical protein